MSRRGSSGTARSGQPPLTLLWRAGPRSSSLERTLAGHGSMMWGVAVTPDGRQAISASWDGTLMVCDLRMGQAVAASDLEEVLTAAVSPDGVTVVAGTPAGNVYCLRNA